MNIRIERATTPTDDVRALVGELEETLGDYAAMPAANIATSVFFEKHLPKLAP